MHQRRRMPLPKRCSVRTGFSSSRILAKLWKGCWFLRRTEELETDEQETLLTLRHLSPEIELAYTLVQQFTQMLRTRTEEQLDAWLEHARASQLRELQRVVLSIERDKAAVVAGLTFPQNNDHVA